MIDVKALQPNYATWSSQEVQAVLPSLEEEMKRTYLAVMEKAPMMLASYLPNHLPTEAPAPHYAAIKGSIEQLEALEGLVDLKTASKGLTSLHYALAYRQEDAIRFLIEKCDLGHLTPDGNSYLHYAALTGDPDIVQLFLDRGIDPAIRNKDSLSAAHLWAFTSNDLTCLQQLSLPEGQGETYHFTPLQLMALNAAHADGEELSESEWNLFFTHLADLGVISLSQLCAGYRINNIGTSCLEFLHTFMQIVKADSIHKLAPSKLKDATDPDTIKMLHIQQLVPVPEQMRPFFRMPTYSMALQSSLSASAVAWKTLTEMPKLMQLSWKTALTTTAIRFGNMLFSTRDAWLALDYPRYDPRYDPELREASKHCYSDAMRKIGGMSNEEVKQLPDLAAECQARFPHFLPPETPVGKARSKEIHNIFRSASILVHPDKCESCAQSAFQHLSKLYQLIPAVK